MKTRTTAALSVLAAALLIAFGAPAADPQPKPAAPADDAQDFVFLGESQPVLVRMHVHIDGRSLQAGWDECIDYLFAYLDVNKDGVLSKEELERAPTADQFVGAGPEAAFGPRGGGPSAVKFEAVDADGDGKVTRAELAAYYRKNGFAPFQFSFPSSQGNPIASFAALYGGGRVEPSVEDVRKAIFDLLDTDKDGKLSKAELEAAPAVLLKLDENEDEIITPHELVPDAGDKGNGLAAMIAMGPPTVKQQSSSPQLVPVLKAGEVPADLAKRLTERYAKGAKEEKKQLRWKDLGLDDATVKQLDTNGDGIVDTDELGGLVKRTPDLELVLRVGKKKDAEKRLEVLTGDGRPPLASKLALTDAAGMLDLGRDRAELRHDDPPAPERIALMRQEYAARFRQADANGDGVLDAEEARKGRFGNLFKAMDRAGAGKVTEKDMEAYFDHLEELQKRVAAGCVTLTLSDQSRGLFDLLDADRDGRLSVYEMRQAPKLLKQLGKEEQGFLTREDIPRTFRLEVRRGSLNAGRNSGLAAVADLYSASYSAESEHAQRGPLWFRKMDRNRDGFVSRKEWLFDDELFKKIDTDGDGLISVEEAIKADELFRRGAEKQQR
jgi:Ca2+-binding EF-hand superfamily protein